jgi:hypothetical protein
LRELDGLGELVVADLEGAAWPLGSRTFGAVIVTHYLWRPLFPTLLAALEPGGVLLYETFAHGQAAHGRPTRPDFLLQPGELISCCAELEIVAYECGTVREPVRCLQRIVARRPRGDLSGAAGEASAWLQAPSGSKGSPG